MLVLLIYFSLIFALIRLIFILKDETPLIQNFALSVSEFIIRLDFLLVALYLFKTSLFQLATKISYQSKIITFSLYFSFDELSISYFYLPICISYICIIFARYTANFKALAILVFFFELLLLLNIPTVNVYLCIKMSFGPSNV